MPTVLLKDGFRFFFYSSEGNEPQHIHVNKGDAIGKIWLEQNSKIAYLHNFTKSEERHLLQVIETNFYYFKNKWNEYFSK
ncbi:MAG: DUF4160 domain-containing protein [Bacteroidota bacterium]|nr:DUF4160 domain-containing protein [Bacteroidota bacterium]